MGTVKLTRKQAKPILEATFPEYRGRKIKVEFTDRVTFWDTNWGGGTRNYYKFVHVSGKVATLAPAAPWMNVVEGHMVLIPEDVLVVMHSIFCGKDVGVTVYCNPRNAPKWLEAGR